MGVLPVLQVKDEETVIAAQLSDCYSASLIHLVAEREENGHWNGLVGGEGGCCLADSVLAQSIIHWMNCPRYQSMFIHSMLLYVHRDCKDCWGWGALDVHLEFHTAPGFWEDVHLMEFMYLVFTYLPSESYCKQHSQHWSDITHRTSSTALEIHLHPQWHIYLPF